MKLRTVSVLALLALGITLVTACPVAAQDMLHARVSCEDGGAMVQGTEDDDWSFAGVNTLILPGDTLWVDKGDTVEVEMSGGTFLRMADGSKGEFISLPPSAVVQGWAGAFYVQRISRSTGDVAFRTPVATVQIPKDSQVRIDILANGATTVTVRWGTANVKTDAGGDVTVSEGKRTFIDPGYLPATPVPFDRNQEDDFDTWNRERARLLALGADAVPSLLDVEEAPIGAMDLADYGDWVTVDSIRYWRPTVVVKYVPYRYGYWSYTPAFGYVWVDSYPFGYVTCHYGRWTHHRHYGWLWTYQPGWGPAWVGAVYHGPHLIWAPLDPFGHTVVIGTAQFTFGDLRFSIAASSYCFADDLILGPSVVHGVHSRILRNIRRHHAGIWNIHRHHRPDFKPPGTGPGRPVRDLSPQRVIRGPEVLPHRGPSAAARIADLERTVNRPQFTAIARSGERRIRTAGAASERQAQPITVARSRPGRLDRRTPIVGRVGTEQGIPSTARVIRSREVSGRRFLEPSFTEEPQTQAPTPSPGTRTRPERLSEPAPSRQISSVRTVKPQGYSPPPARIAMPPASPRPSRTAIERPSRTPSRPVFSTPSPPRSSPSTFRSPSPSISAPRGTTRSTIPSGSGLSSRGSSMRSIGTSSSTVRSTSRSMSTSTQSRSPGASTRSYRSTTPSRSHSMSPVRSGGSSRSVSPRSTGSRGRR